MESISIQVGPPLTETRTGEITGRISVCIDEWYFPEAEWRDFVVVVIGWWATAMRDFRVRGTAVLNFMDGPFEVRLNAGAGDEVVAEFVSRSSRGNATERVASVSRQQLATAVGEAARSALQIVRATGSTADTTPLEEAARDLLSDAG